MHDIRVKMCMPDFSGIKIITHQFHVDKEKGDTWIGYEMIIY